MMSLTSWKLDPALELLVIKHNNSVSYFIIVIIINISATPTKFMNS